MSLITENPRTSNPESASTPERPGFYDYVHAVVSRWRMIAAITASFACLSVVYALYQPNIYTATTMILPTQEEKGMSSMLSQLGALAGMAGASLGGQNAGDLYVSLLKCDAIKAPIVERFKLRDVYREKYLADTCRRLDKATHITLGKKDSLITVAVDDTDPKRSATIANAYADELGKMTVRLNITSAGKNRAFLDERLAKAKADLAQAEDALKAFQSRNKTFNVPEQAKAAIEGIAKLKAELVSREVQLNTLRRTYTETSQEVKNVATAVAQLRGQIARLEGPGNGGAIPTAGAAPVLGQEYLRLMREFKIQEAMVELLTKQREMASINESKDIAPFQVVQRAEVPERKSKPARAKLVVKATFAGMFLAVLLIVIQENLARVKEADKQRWKSLFRGARNVDSAWAVHRDRGET